MQAHSHCAGSKGGKDLEGGPSSWAAVMAFFDSGWLSEVRGSPSLISGHLYATLCEGGCQVVSVRVWKQVVCVCNIVATVPHHNCQGPVCTKCPRLCPCPPLPLIHTVGMHSFDAECRW
jgi:hypothetical protein